MGRDGIYRKYEVNRTDGRDGPGQKHQQCFLFVLDIDHDPYARAALAAYAKACVGELPELATDLMQHLTPEGNPMHQDARDTMDEAGTP